MEFIRTYFNTKIEAAKGMIGATKTLLEYELWGKAVLAILWTMFCIIGGSLFLPIDIIGSAILWYTNPDIRDFMKDLEEEFTEAQEYFSEETES